MKKIHKRPAERSSPQEKQKVEMQYRIPKLIWMTDVKKSLESGGLLFKKNQPKRID
jgi:hypothetical protein